MRQIVRVFAVLSFLFAAFTLAAHADTVYTYTGNGFTFQASPPYTSSDSVSGSFTVASPLADNLSFYVVPPTTFSFRDGYQTLDNTNATQFIYLSTNADGKIVFWDVNLTTANGTIATIYDAQPVDDVDFGDVTLAGGAEGTGTSRSPGQWTSATVASPVPEPSSIALLGTGLLGLAGIARRKFSRL